MKTKKRIFCFFWKYIGIHSIGIGINIDVKNLILEIHLPFGFISIGFHKFHHILPINWKECDERNYGFGPFRHMRQK